MVAPAFAAPTAISGKTAPVVRASPKEARALLEKAAAYLERNTPERAYAAFNNQKGEFVRGDLYVFVVGLDGVMHAHGGAVEGMVGMNVMDLRDAAGKALIREMIDAVQTADSGSIEYVWLNRVTNKVENKLTEFRKVGNNVVGVGSYLPRSSAEQAKALLQLAVSEMGKVGPTVAFSEFNARRSPFYGDDLYVFAVGVEDGRFYAMGATPELVGNDVRGLRDAAGKPIIADMLRLATESGVTLYDYVWRNPANNKVENKHSFVQRVGPYVLGVGYYTR
jgi:cytochrome c